MHVHTCLAAQEQRRSARRGQEVAGNQRGAQAAHHAHAAPVLHAEQPHAWPASTCVHK